MRRATAVLIISSALIFSGCAKGRASDILVDTLPQTRVEQVMTSDTGKSEFPQKVLLSVKDRAQWLGSARVRDSLQKFDAFEKLFPEISAQIGRALRDCTDDASVELLISKIGFIANNTPSRPLANFGVVEPFDDLTLYLSVLSDRDADKNEKLGVLALMMLSLRVHESLMVGSATAALSTNPLSSASELESQLRSIMTSDPKLTRPIGYFLSCFKSDPGFVLDTVASSQLAGLRDAFSN
ncbi:Uncharacterised protein [Candidatus Bilamarchaeum dharawalense]|uniref:Lipoprotein n=1 Tax=Candidatus Bilamarchaeum dharawalense TaxID=2885759 RepID=A0A5E4LLK3_9ARCH|nr:Uncharacterised protein [Candidatus Bilamarchaeum dharawalense]